MDDDMIESADFGYFELARRLEAYADQRLSPSLVATTRMRTAVMTAAHRRAALIKADATFDAARATTSARAHQHLAAEPATANRSPWRRPVAAVMVGCLSLALLAGTALAAEPGGPLYAVRIWTEMATLPGNLADRAQAEIGRLQDRLDEAQRASAEGDVFGTEAALAAYSAIVVEAANGSGGDPAASAAIAASVKDQMATLRLMLKDLPGPARAAAQAALSSSTTALGTLDGPSRDGGGDQKVGVPGADPTASPRPDKATTGTGGPSPKPAASPNPGAPTKTPPPVKPIPIKNDNTVKAHQPPSPSPHPSGGHGTSGPDQTVQDPQ
ncbi:MAG TPA: hypothetical protein VIM25_08550 [Candidatus Limnocylindrales bacterium]